MESISLLENTATKEGETTSFFWSSKYKCTALDTAASNLCPTATEPLYTSCPTQLTSFTELSEEDVKGLIGRSSKKKAIWRDVLSLQNEQSHWLLCVYKNHATVTWIERSLTVKWIENLQRRQNWTVKSTNVKENAGVNSDFVIRAALWAKKLDVPLNSAGVGEISLDWKAPGTCGARKAIYS